MIEDLSKIDDVTEHPRIGIFGLGIMGGAIAKNLVDDGYQVFGYDPHMDPVSYTHLTLPTRLLV